MEATIDHIPRPSVAETLAHIAPGGALLGAVYLFELWVSHSLPRNSGQLHLPITTALSFIGGGLKGENWLLPLLLALALLLAIYITGHLIDSISALCLDRTLIYRAYGYPYQHLFGYLPRELEPDGVPEDHVEGGLPTPRPGEAPPAPLQADAAVPGPGTQPAAQTTESAPAVALEAPAGPDGQDPAAKTAPAARVPVPKLFDAAAPRTTRPMHPRWMRFTRSYYRVIFLWLNVYLGLRWVALAGRDWNYAFWPTAFGLVADFIGFGVMVLLVGSFFLDHPRLRAKVEGDRAARESRFWRVAWFAIRTPYDLAVKPLATTFDTRRSFDRTFIKKYEASFRSLFHMEPETAESNNFWFSLLYVREESTRLSRILLHWQTMYEFSRNLSTALYLAGMYTLWWVAHYEPLVARAAANGNRVILFCPAAFLALAAMMFVYFYYLYVCYYSKFLYRSFVFLAERELAAGTGPRSRRGTRRVAARERSQRTGG